MGNIPQYEHTVSHAAMAEVDSIWGSAVRMLKEADGCPFPGTHHSNEHDYWRSTGVGVGVVPVCPVRILSGLDHDILLNPTPLKTDLISVNAVVLVPLCAGNYSLIR